MNFSKVGLRLVHRAAVHYTGALRFLTLLSAVGSPREARQVFERVNESLTKLAHMVREHRKLYPSAVPAENLIGAACFFGALEFVKGGNLHEFAYALALTDGILRENFVGPLEADEDEKLKRTNLPLVRDLSGVGYRLFSPEKSVSRFYAQQFQVAAARFRKEAEREEEARRRVEVKRNAVSPRDFLLSFSGTFVSSYPLNGRTVYLELKGNGLKIRVVRADGFAENLRGKSFGRGKLPGVIYREIKRGFTAHSDRTNGHRERRQRGNLRFIPGAVRRVA